MKNGIGKYNKHYYTGNHLSSMQLVTDGTGVAVQQVEHAPFGEVVNEYNIDWRNGQVPDFKFNGKELDEESGMYYFEARYQSPPVFISRDPLFGKYPMFSPYAYCANNPVKYIDPDGRKIVAADRTTKKYIKKYLKDQFGSSKMFRFNSDNELQIRESQYKKALASANSNQRILLEGIEQAIQAEPTAKVMIKENECEFDFTPYTLSYENNEPKMVRSPNETIMRVTAEAGGNTAPYSKNIDAYPIGIRHDGGENQTYSTGLLSRPTTGKNASSLFMHEVLDKFLNYFVYDRKKDSQLQHVFYQNAALENKGLHKRNGDDHAH
ncbi:MAG: RHS repeat-associated core domain-containing protein [Bacteroidales bacterium]|jgi:RHS repeat-associated protein|nr:RHS repeat-associated core domain-containing protein [Bacteroidales bacterium]